MAYKYTKRELAEIAEANARLAAHFTIGNVIRSNYWGTCDRVIDFVPNTDNRSWYVTVIHCDEHGTPIAGERNRTHFTSPDKRDVIVCNVVD